MPSKVIIWPAMWNLKPNSRLKLPFDPLFVTRYTLDTPFTLSASTGHSDFLVLRRISIHSLAPHYLQYLRNLYPAPPRYSRIHCPSAPCSTLHLFILHPSPSPQTFHCSLSRSAFLLLAENTFLSHEAAFVGPLLFNSLFSHKHLLICVYTCYLTLLSRFVVDARPLHFFF